MRKLLMFCLLVCTFSLSVHAQSMSSEDIKLRNKAQKLKEKKKYTESIEIYKQLSVKYYLEESIWNEFFEVAMKNYIENPQLNGISISITDKQDVAVGNDTISNMLTEMLNKAFNSNSPETIVKEVCRATTMLGLATYQHDIFLRSAYIEKNSLKDVPDKAMTYYQKAETFFATGNYKSAADFYKKAIDEHPDFFKAILYLGDVYYMTEQYDLAIESFKTCHEKFPTYSEPIKFLSDAYYKYGAYDAAYQSAITGVMVYPDLNMKEKLEIYAGEVGKSIRFSPIMRYVLPNSKVNKSIEWLKIESNEYWTAYQNAFNDIKEYTNNKGIVAANDVTLHELSEVYCWSKMLDAFPDNPILDVAREMKAKGFLDCYVLIDNYHVDLYEQFRHLVNNNPDHVKAYFEYLSTRK